MDTDLTSVSTHGWFVEPAIDGYLLPVSTFGWWYEITGAAEGLPDIISFILNINRVVEMTREI